ncbi:MAG: FAD-dependent oxidoreductase [Candidatus Krumholzibacteriia bacterium]
MMRFANERQLETYRESLQAAHDPTRTRICVCGGTGCNAQGSRDLVRELRAAVDRHGLADRVEVKATGCHGFCEKGPVVVVRPANIFYVLVKPADADELVRVTCVENGVVERLQYVDPASGERIVREQDVPFYKKQTRVILADNGHLDPTSIDDYLRNGGYAALGKALSRLTPEEVIDEVKRAGLRGRGGAGFPTARKWELCRQQPGNEKYIICNADEGDPGAYMNRSELEGNPHLMIEGMIIGAYAIGASKAYIYCRAEYPLAIEQLKQAIAQARECGLLGENILDSGFSLDMVIKMGAGAFVCGEETALMASIEGKRGMPRPRPPFPAQSGVFGKPSNINNVETWCNVPLILARGADWFAGIGSEKSKGTKVFSLVGCVNNTGLVEVPFGTSLREIVNEIGGGVPRGRKFKAAQMGGPSGGCIPASQMDVRIDYESLQSLGAIVGSGGLVVMDESTCMVDLAKYFMEFIQSESCGKCIPCREGTRRMHEILVALTRPRGKDTELDALLRFQGVMELERLAEVIRRTSLCGLGQTAPNPVLSTLRWFREEYEQHVFERRCAAGSCKELVGAPCQNGCPVGTEVWRYVAHIGRGEVQEAYRAIRNANPFPSACARVCNHPCEMICRAGAGGGDPVAIRTLKRYVVDHVDPDGCRPDILPAAPDAKRVAVVGAGPSGLTAAHELSKRGYRVTLIEREAQAGGMLVAGIPAYRLPRDILAREIAALLDPNITLRLNTALGRDVTLDELRRDHAAVYLTLGSHRSKTLGLPGEEVAGVVPGIRFLKAWNLGGECLARGRVGVVGGGNSALDAARVAFRQPGVEAVTLLYRRSREEMPAYEEEIQAALEEGIVLETMVAPVGLAAADGHLAGVRLQRNRLGAPDAGGRRRPVPIEGSEFTLPLDTLVVAISEEPELEALAALPKTRGGGLSVAAESGATSLPGVFAGGDITTGPNTVIAAIAAGKDAALMIDRHLRGRQLKRLPRVLLPTVFVAPPVESEESEAAPAQRVHQPCLAAGERRQGFAEVELCISREDAIREARRCMRCDLEFAHPA